MPGLDVRAVEFGAAAVTVRGEQLWGGVFALVIAPVEYTTAGLVPARDLLIR